MSTTLKIDGYRAGVGIMLINQEGKVFVGERIDAPNAWQMPQGGIEIGEEPSKAVFRELKEEIGTNNARIIKEAENWIQYDFPDYIAQKCWNGKYKGQVQKWFLMEFLGDDSEIDLLNSDEQEFTQWKWTDRDTLLDFIVDFKKDLYRDVLKELDN